MNVEKQAVPSTLAQPASSNETASVSAEASGNGEADADATQLTDISFDSSPYPVILEKTPFGRAPEPTAPNTASPPIEDPMTDIIRKKIADSFSWTAINITPEGKTAIGFTDLSAKLPASYYLTVGESANEWKVIDADYATETATIEKVVDGNKVSISCKLGNKSPITPATPGATPGLTPGASPLLPMSGRIQ